MTYAAEVGLGKTSLVWRTLTAGRLLITAVLHCACTLDPGFCVCVCMMQPQICVFLFACGGNLEYQGERHTQVHNRLGLPSHTRILFFSAAGDRQIILGQCEDVFYRSLKAKWIWPVKSFHCIYCFAQHSFRFLPGESSPAAWNKIKLFITHFHLQGIQSLVISKYISDWFGNKCKLSSFVTLKVSDRVFRILVSNSNETQMLQKGENCLLKPH